MDGGERARAVAKVHAELERRFGAEWRVFPVPAYRSHDEAADQRAWRDLRDSFVDIIDGAALGPVDLTDLVAVVVAAFAPPDADPGPVAVATQAWAEKMVAAGVPAPLAALDALVARVASGHPSLAESVDGGDVPVEMAASRWSVATLIAESLLAGQLAAAGKRVTATFGAGAIGGVASSLGVGGAGGSGPGDLAVRYRAAAARYIGWQQAHVCHCLPATDPTVHKNGSRRHFLHRWNPGRRGDDGKFEDTPDLLLWFRTWVVGQQPKREVDEHGEPTPYKAVAFEAGLFYRHYLPGLPDTSLHLVVDNILDERCAEPGCPTIGVRARRVGRHDPAGAGVRGHRRCPTAPDHVLDFTQPKRFRGVIVLGARTSHERYDNLVWGKANGAWEFAARRGGKYWLAIPYGTAHARLFARGAAVEPGWTPPLMEDNRVRYRTPAPEPDADTTVDPDADTDEDALAGPAGSGLVDCLDDVELARLHDLLMEQTEGTGAAVLVSVLDLLEPTGLIDVDPYCDCCRAAASPFAGVATGDYCDQRLTDLLSDWLAIGAPRTGDRS